MKFALGSASERKIKISEAVLKEFLGPDAVTVIGVAAASGVPETPYDRETFDGARNRALAAKAAVGDAAFGLGLESGLVERYGQIFEEAWAVIVTDSGEEFYGYSSGLKVPDYILRRMDESQQPHFEVMTVIEEEFGNLPNDTWGTYTGGILARTVSLQEAVRNALVQVVANDRSFYRK